MYISKINVEGALGYLHVYKDKISLALSSVLGIRSAEGLVFESIRGDLYWKSNSNLCISKINVEGALGYLHVYKDKFSLALSSILGIGSAEGLAFESLGGDLYWMSYTNLCISKINVQGMNSYLPFLLY